MPGTFEEGRRVGSSGIYNGMTPGYVKKTRRVDGAGGWQTDNCGNCQITELSGVGPLVGGTAGQAS